MPYQTAEGRDLTNTSARSCQCRHISPNASSSDNCLRPDLGISKLIQMLWETITVYQARHSSPLTTKHLTPHQDSRQTARSMALAAMEACILPAIPLTKEDRPCLGRSCATRRALLHRHLQAQVTKPPMQVVQ